MASPQRIDGCVKRELAMRLFQSGSGSPTAHVQQKADREIEVMEAIAVEFERRPIPVISALDQYFAVAADSCLARWRKQRKLAINMRNRTAALIRRRPSPPPSAP